MSRAPKSSFRTKTFSTPKSPTKIIERNLAATRPEKEQFEPSEAMPMHPRKRMAGAG